MSDKATGTKGNMNNLTVNLDEQAMRKAIEKIRGGHFVVAEDILKDALDGKE